MDEENSNFNEKLNEVNEDEFYKKYFKDFYFIKTHFREFILVVLILWIVMFFLVGHEKMIQFLTDIPLPVLGIVFMTIFLGIEYFKEDNDE